MTRDASYQLADTFMATAAFWSTGGQPWRTGSANPPTDGPDADGAEEFFELILDDSPSVAVGPEDYLEMGPSEAAITASPIHSTTSSSSPHSTPTPTTTVREQVDEMGLSTS